MSDPNRPDYPAAARYQGRVASTYEQRRAHEPTWAWEDEQVRALVTSLPGDQEVLDVPLGSGRYVPLYLDAGWSVHGCDISEDMVRLAEASLGDRFERCDVVVAPAERMPFPDRSMDVIVCGRFFQWLPDLPRVDAVVAEMARVARGVALVQLRIPAARREEPSLRAAAIQAGRAGNRALRRLRRRRAGSSPRLVAHAEPDLLDLFDRHAWHLESIGPECPFDPGLRFYRLRR